MSPDIASQSLKRGQVTHQKCLEAQPHEASNLSTTRSHPLVMFAIHTPPAPPVPDRISSIESVLSPEWFLDHSSSRNQVSSPSFQDQDSSSRFKNQVQEPKSSVKEANEPRYCQPKLKKRSSDPPKVSRSPTTRSLQLEYHQISSLSHVCNPYTSSTPSTRQNFIHRKCPIT